jgi:hypothetical protein
MNAVHLKMVILIYAKPVQKHMQAIPPHGAIMSVILAREQTDSIEGVLFL